jgi:magnesium chelatase subunit I
MLGRLGVPEGEESPQQAAAAVELALEGLHLTRRLAKDSQGGRTVYGA